MRTSPPPPPLVLSENKVFVQVSVVANSKGGDNSHIQSLSKTLCVDICPARRKRAQKFLGNSQVFRESRKSWGIPKISGIAVPIKSILIAYQRLS